MVHDTICRYASGLMVTMKKLDDGGYSLVLSDEQGADCLAVTVDNEDRLPLHIAEIMEAAYRAGRDDGRYQMRSKVMDALSKEGLP